MEENLHRDEQIVRVTPPCPICNHPQRALIDAQILDWKGLRVAAGKGKGPSFSDLMVKVTTQVPSVAEFSTDEIVRHLSCRPAPAPLAIEPAPREQAAQEFVVLEDGERLRVPDPQELAKAILAAGLENIRKHPEIVKPAHILSVLKLLGGVERDEELIELVKRLISEHPGTRTGPFLPPDVETQADA